MTVIYSYKPKKIKQNCHILQNENITVFRRQHKIFQFQILVQRLIDFRSIYFYLGYVE